MAHDEDDEGPPSPERDWDRNISSALESLRPPPDSSSTPAREEILESVSETAQEAERAASGWTRPLLMGAFAVVGVGLIGLAFWPRTDAEAPGRTDAAERSSAAGDPAAAVALERLERLEDALREAGVRERQLVQQLGALGRRVAALENEESDSAERLAALEAQLPGASSVPSGQRPEVPPRSRPDAQAAERDGVAVEPDQAPVPAPEIAPAVVEAGAAAAEAGRVAASSPPRRWTVSLVTLSKRSTAEDYARGVRQRDWPATVREVGAEGGLWQVSSGAFGTRAEAEAHGEEVRRALRLESVWVTRAPGG
ncbi:MAG: SPOR domain-containing protein [Pseudomonadales bacterium]|jgi:hypothetical protein|nr:SPOR domain-containing protein [Pseudomonadales bacterium]